MIHIEEFGERHDQRKIQELIIGIQNGEFSVPIGLKDQPDLSEIENFYQRERGNFWVALAGERIVGTIALVDIGARQVALRKMFVAPEFRGKEKGTAQKLLDTAISWSIEKEIKDIYLGTVSVLQAARRFYEKNSFSEITVQELPRCFPLVAVDTHFYHRTL